MKMMQTKKNASCSGRIRILSKFLLYFGLILFMEHPKMFGVAVVSVSAAGMGNNNNNNNDVYAFYNIPNLVLRLDTTASDFSTTGPSDSSSSSGNMNGLVLLSETNGHNSGLSFPLRYTTQSFLLEAFATKIVSLQTQENIQDPSMEYPWFPLYAHLANVELSIRLYLVDIVITTTDADANIDDANNNGRRQLQGNLGSSTKTTVLRAEITGSLSFREQEQTNVKPSNDQVWQVFGDWMEEIFVTKRDEYFERLVQTTDQALLKELTRLEITVDDSSNTSSNGSGSNNNNNNNNKFNTTSVTDGPHWTLFLFLSMTVVLVFYIIQQRRQKYRSITMMMTHPSSQQQQQQQQQLPSHHVGYTDNDDDDGNGYNFSGKSIAVESHDDMDLVRHGADTYPRSRSDAMSVLESTDRYLFKHRPELYTGDGNGDGKDNTSGNGNSQFQVFGREYSIPSNPLQLLYASFSTPLTTTGNGTMIDTSTSSSFEPSSSGAFTPRRSSLQELPTQNLAAVVQGQDKNNGAGDHHNNNHNRETPFDEEPHDINYSDYTVRATEESYTTEQSGYRPMAAIWRNLTHLTQRWDQERRYGQDGIMVATPTPSDLELQTYPYSDYHDDNPDGGGGDRDNILPLPPPEEDVVFQDFPRHDGTPCLIFNEHGNLLTPRQREVFEIDSFSFDDRTNTNTSTISNGKSNSAGKSTDNDDEATTPVSDEVFQRMLAQQGHENVGDSPDASMLLDSSLIVDTNTTDESSFTNAAAMSLNISIDSVTPNFKEKLAGLYEQKHRQYEKKSIVEKHQAKRNKNRREQERRDRHKDMEGTIGWLEESTGTTPRWQQSQSSPNPYRFSPHRKSKQQMSPRPNTTNFSPHRSHSDNISRASPMRMHHHQQQKHQHIDQPADISNSSFDEIPFKMRPRTTQVPLSALGVEGDILADGSVNHRPSKSIDHSTIDKLSMPPMTTAKKYSPNAVLDDIFGGAPVMLSRRKNSLGSTTNSSNGSSRGPPPPPPKMLHRRVNSFDPRQTLQIERPLPQQRRRPQGSAGGGRRALTPTRGVPRTRSRTPTRTLSPARPLTPSTFTRDTSSRVNTSGNSSSNLSLSNSRHRRSSSHSHSGDIYTHGVGAHTRFV